MKYKLAYSTNFKKDFKNLQKQGKDLSKLNYVINKLLNNEILEPKYCNHKLKGKSSDYWDCHIEPDWVLIYQKKETELIIQLSRTGSHAKVFN